MYIRNWSTAAGDGTSLWVLLDLGSFPIRHPSGYVWFLWAFSQLQSQSVMTGMNLNQNPCMPSWTGVFLFVIFLSVALSGSRCMFTSGLFQVLLNLINQFSIYVMFLFFPYFTPKLFNFFCIRLLICHCALSTNLLVEFSFVFFLGKVISCFMYFAWLCPITFWVYVFPLISFDLFLLVVLSDLSEVVFFEDLYIPLGSCVFYFSQQFLLLLQFLYLSI